MLQVKYCINSKPDMMVTLNITKLGLVLKATHKSTDYGLDYGETFALVAKMIISYFSLL